MWTCGVGQLLERCGPRGRSRERRGEERRRCYLLEDGGQLGVVVVFELNVAVNGGQGET